MSSKVARCSLAFVQLLIVLALKAQTAGTALTRPPLILRDNQPARTWMTEAYPMGNGRIGGMVFGGIAKEHIQFNEQSLWTGDERETGAYQAFGDIHISFLSAGGQDSGTQYRRQLDLNTAVQQISYRKGHVSYQREYFCSFPDKVMVLHFTASEKGAYSAVIQLKDAHNAPVTGEGASLQIAGRLENGLQYQATAMVQAEGGTIAVEPDGHNGSQLRIQKANGFTILLAAATDYVNLQSKGWRGEAPAGKVRQALSLSSRKTYQQLLSAHLQDYQALFNRVALTLGDRPAPGTGVTTRQSLVQYQQKADPGLEALLFQYGRYLLISSSRKGGLPANLQGLWNERNDPPWRSDYHSNINIQMNYWPAEPVNLSECDIPYLDYINSMREVKKQNTRKEYPGTRGWTVRTENNIYGGESFIWNTPGSAWYMQGIWEHYAFTQNKEYLRNFAYPILKEVVEFWDDHLKRRPDGTLVSPMGWSPEHGPQEDGVSFDQEIVYDLFTNYIQAADILKIDASYRNHVADMRDHLLMPKIGKWGQLQEWETDRDDPNDKHRHSSNLFGLYPGQRISISNTPDLASAAKISLTARGDLSTGWAMAWKMNFWARLEDGDHAYRILNNFITLTGGVGVDYDKGGGVYSNLLCAHPPFQIDGNLGYTAGVAEMLVQSQTGVIQLLPALPAAWKTGAVKGLRARGGFEITDLEWKDGNIRRLTIKSFNGGECRIAAGHPLAARAFPVERIEDGQRFVYSFKTVAGKTYQFAGSSITGQEHAATTYPEEGERKVSKGNCTYYIDPVKGSDDYSGTRRTSAWKTFMPVNRLILSAGDKVEIIAPGAFNESLALIARGKKTAHVRVRFAPGLYHFYRERAFKTKLNISNTNDTPDSLKAIAVHIQASSFTDVEGSGATLVMHGKMMETFIDHSSYVDIHGLTYDYYRPTISEMKVLETGADFADLEVNPNSWYAIRDSALTWVGEGWQYQPISLWQVLDTVTDDLQRVNIEMNGLRYEETGKNRIRVRFAGNPGFQKGLIYQNRDITRDCAGIFLQRSEHIGIRNVSIYYMHGMGVVSQFCENISIDSLSVRPNPATGLTCAAWADILHFSGCRGKIRISHSYLSAANDDAVNVHGTYLRIMEAPRPDQLLVRFMHNQTYGFDAFAAGDSIALIHHESLLQYDSNIVIKSEPLNNREFLLTLKKPLAVSPRANDVVENTSWTPEVWIHHTTIARIPTRGILVTTRKKATIENNLFKGTHYSAVCIADDAGSWFESGMVKDVTIRNNTFSFCGAPVISISPENTVSGTGYVHHNIAVTDNIFQLQSNLALYAKSTSGIRITGNRFCLAGQPGNTNNLFRLEDCTGVQKDRLTILPACPSR